ncbi:MAG: peptide chain release factor N(5)-glutamine methyltransferase, partial [Bacteroidota bacterium]|nr:peptide chain release factor N(5)-glutamine methyltransferase [Bacteroidota bacterium]
QAQKRLEHSLLIHYDEREAAFIADWVMEKCTGRPKIDRVLGKQESLEESAARSLEKFSQELIAGRPVQYVLNEAWFCGMKLYVDERVLIPRPETEELVEWIATDWSGAAPSILDVGTGSGCIPIALKKRLSRSAIFACDVSASALAVARGNAAAHGTGIEFLETNFLDRDQRVLLPSVEVLVSNPPYVPFRDKGAMAAHVVGFEPHLALFVSDEDPLVFYRNLASFAKERGAASGRLYVEIHEEQASGVADILESSGLSEVIVKRDMQGKDRLIKATW